MSDAALGALAVACAVGAGSDVLALVRGAAGTRRTRMRRRHVALVGLARRMPVPRGPGDLPARLAAAGAPRRFGPQELMAAKCAFAVSALGAALVAEPALPGRLGLLALAGAPGGGFLVPDLLLLRRARCRARAARAEAPDLLDRIGLAVAAGLPPARALERAARDCDGPIAAELRRLTAASAWGAGREEGLRRLAESLPVPEARALAAAVRRSERHGTPLGPAVAALADGARASGAQRVRDRAQRAAPKIQLVVALLLVPSVLLLVAAGLLAGLR